ncbi:hypothetical protein AV521_13210 [Streptomyces sp. IMTB 2501]|uniref:hypothetical protein n=1 Tax=Streptomyces sp. IMTB 2501 TaxID=1776340 RepID=UPI00096D8294|nr:hypothetical protein [Streptomyces sp. IMTB 2501]OLZ70951.1 hypothetical protein AV521_13210 [Streptomyces sp. IMTB 2501]
MGERHSGDGSFGRPHGHPGGTLSAPDHVAGSLTASGFEARLAAALRADGIDAEAERRAVAAFRAARETQASPARTRRRDDWRPAAPRRGRRSLRVTLSLAFASLALGGVAVAAIGSARSGSHARPDTPRPAHPSASGPLRPGTPGASAGPGSASPSARPHHPATARDTVAHCRTYERAGERGGALDSTAWRRLVAEAGGADKVTAYCVAQVTNGTTGGGETGGKDPKPGKPGEKSESGDGSSKQKPTTGKAKSDAGSGKSATGGAKQGDGKTKAANGG